MKIIYWILIIILILVAVFIFIRNGGKEKLKKIFGSAEAHIFKKLKMDDDLLNEVQEKKKTIDVRVKNGLTEKIKKGDYIHYFSGFSGRDVLVEVSKVNSYNNIDELIKNEKFSSIYPSTSKDISDSDKKLMFVSKDQGGKGYYSESDLNNEIFAFHFKTIAPPDKK